jgi:hypothetical protein
MPHTNLLNYPVLVSVLCWLAAEILCVILGKLRCHKLHLRTMFTPSFHHMFCNGLLVFLGIQLIGTSGPRVALAEQILQGVIAKQAIRDPQLVRELACSPKGDEFGLVATPMCTPYGKLVRGLLEGEIFLPFPPICGNIISDKLISCGERRHESVIKPLCPAELPLKDSVFL